MGVGSSLPAPSFPLRREILAQGLLVGVGVLGVGGFGHLLLLRGGGGGLAVQSTWNAERLYDDISNLRKQKMDSGIRRQMPNYRNHILLLSSVRPVCCCATCVLQSSALVACVLGYGS